MLAIPLKCNNTITWKSWINNKAIKLCLRNKTIEGKNQLYPGSKQRLLILPYPINKLSAALLTYKISEYQTIRLLINLFQKGIITETDKNNSSSITLAEPLDIFRNTITHYAAEKGYSLLLRYLLLHGAPFFSKNCFGKTPFTISETASNAINMSMLSLIRMNRAQSQHAHVELTTTSISNATSSHQDADNNIHAHMPQTEVISPTTTSTSATSSRVEQFQNTVRDPKWHANN